eukprot:scaffold18100_cov149-Isochrysis_galbana.AAC.2
MSRMRGSRAAPLPGDSRMPPDGTAAGQTTPNRAIWMCVRSFFLVDTCRCRDCAARIAPAMPPPHSMPVARRSQC